MKAFSSLASRQPLFFFFNDTATTEIYTLSLHDALPISAGRGLRPGRRAVAADPSARFDRGLPRKDQDRKSTRLNSSHTVISYAVFCLKKKKQLPRRQALHHRRGHER